MRKLVLSVLSAALALAGSGCVVVLGVDDLPRDRHVVTIDGALYVVDLDTHRVQKVDAEFVTPLEEADAEAEDAEGD